jgi:hypothetical protein
MDGTHSTNGGHEKYTLVTGYSKWKGYVEGMGGGGWITLISALGKEGEDMNFRWMRMDPTSALCECGTQTLHY